MCHYDSTIDVSRVSSLKAHWNSRSVQESLQLSHKKYLSQRVTNDKRTVGSGEIWQGIVALLLRHDLGHHACVVWERSDAQTFHYDVRQMVRIQHEMLATILQHVFVILALILQYLLHCITHAMQHTCVAPSYAVAVTVTVTKALALCPLLEDRGCITESIRILVPVDRMKQKCFQITTKRIRRLQQFRLRQ